MYIKRLKHEFVGDFSNRLEVGILYISLQYGELTHLCCCGCGFVVTIALAPNLWQVTFDGESVTLYPAINSEGLQCQSRYLVIQSQVIPF